MGVQAGKEMLLYVILIMKETDLGMTSMVFSSQKKT